MSFHARFFSVLVLVFLFILTPAYAAEENLTSPDIQETTADNGTKKLQEEQKIQALTGPVILDISVQGNVEVVTEHIMSIITSKVGEPVDEEKLRGRTPRLSFELGFFVATDYRVTDKADGVDVVFLVQENPVVSKINFDGNTVYSNEKLEEMIFTKPGMIFNRTFFRNIQRIKEKYQADGYVMANVADVRIEGTEINVVIIWNKDQPDSYTGKQDHKDSCSSQIPQNKEESFSTPTSFRLSLSRLQGVGFLAT